jgi:hypothetical protein
MCLGIAVGAGGLGGLACHSLASSYEKSRQELAGKENDLDARLKYVRELNEASEKLNNELNVRVAEVSKRNGETVKRIEQGNISSGELAKEREALLKEEQNARDQVKLEEAALKDMKKFQKEQLGKNTGDKALHAELDAEIQKQERLLQETAAASRAFANESARI